MPGCAAFEVFELHGRASERESPPPPACYVFLAPLQGFTAYKQCTACTRAPVVPAPPPTPPGAKNVLFVPIDDQRPCYRSYGQPCISPAHDRLAREGTLFTRAFAQFAWCAPSRNSFMSGRRPDRTKAWDFEHHFREPGIGADWVSLPQKFKTDGWFTTGVGKLFHPGLPPNFDAVSWTDPHTYPITFVGRGSACPAPGCDGAKSSGGPQAAEEFDNCDGKLADLALERLKIAADLYHNRSQPFFLGLGFMNPHIPYHFPAEYASLYSVPTSFAIAKFQTLHSSQPTVGWYDQGDTFTSPVGMGTYGDVQQLGGGIALRRPMNATHQQIVRRNNYAATTFTDAQLGRVLSAMDEMDLTNSTLVCSFADHGQSLGEQNLWEKMSVFEASTRVHLIIRAPWLPQSAGKVVSSVVELVSLYRTLTELAGIAPESIEPGVQGTSFASLVAGGPSPPKRRGELGIGYAMSQMTRCHGEGASPNPATSVYYACGFTRWCHTHGGCKGATPGLRNYTYMGYSVRNASWRLTIWARWNASTLCPSWNDSTNQVELYDHRRDVAVVDFDTAEHINVALEPANTQVLEQLTSVVREFYAQDCSRARITPGGTVAAPTQ
jgi:iduronate 2-sulfatase